MARTLLLILALSLSLSSHAQGNEESAEYGAETLYNLLVAELAGQQQQFDIALGNYLLEAHRTQDAGVAARATQIAQYIGAEQAALDAATLWSRLDPQSAQAQQAMSIEQLRAEHLADAMLALKKALELDPGLQVQYLTAYTSSLNKNSRSQLLERLSTLHNSHPDNPSISLTRAILLQQQQDLNAADTELNALLKKHLKYYPAWMLKARLLTAQNKDDAALDTVKRALKHFPKDKALGVLKARLQVKVKDIKGARKTFAQLSEQFPDDGAIRLPLALTLLELGEYSESREQFQILLEQGDLPNEAHFYLARLDLHDGQYDTALEHFLAMDGGRDYLSAQAQIVQLYVKKEAYGQAIAHLQKQRELDSDNRQTYYLMEVELLNRQKRYDDAADLLNEALSDYQDNVDLRYSRAMVAEKLGNYPQLEQDLTFIINAEPENATALNALGYTLADRAQRLEEALKLIQRARELAPEDPAILDSLGWVYFRLGKLQEALNNLRQAYNLMPDPEIAAHLGEVLWQQGMFKEARNIWEEALSKQPNNLIIKRTMERLIKP